MIALPILATVLFPVIVYLNERGTDGRWRPRGKYGFISKRAAYLRFIPVLVMFWLPYLTLGGQ